MSAKRWRSYTPWHWADWVSSCCSWWSACLFYLLRKYCKLLNSTYYTCWERGLNVATLELVNSLFFWWSIKQYDFSVSLHLTLCYCPLLTMFDVLIYASICNRISLLNSAQLDQQSSLPCPQLKYSQLNVVCLDRLRLQIFNASNLGNFNYLESFNSLESSNNKGGIAEPSPRVVFHLWLFSNVEIRE